MKKIKFTLPWTHSLLNVENKVILGKLCSDKKDPSLHIDYGSKLDFYVPDPIVSGGHKKKLLNKKKKLVAPLRIIEMEGEEGDIDVKFGPKRKEKKDFYDSFFRVMRSKHPLGWGRLKKRVKGGFEVATHGIFAFLPGSLLVRAKTYKLWKIESEKLFGHFLFFKFLNIRIFKRFNSYNIIVSRLHAISTMNKLALQDKNKNLPVLKKYQSKFKYKRNFFNNYEEKDISF